MSMGNETGSMLTKTLHIDSVLVAQKVPGLRFQFLLYPHEDHISVLPRAFFDGFRFVFPLGEPAIECFRKNIELYPSSGNAYDSYGEVLMNKGDKANAILNYKKSLILMPENENAREMLKKLGE